MSLNAETLDCSARFSQVRGLMEARKLLWFMALAFSLVLLVQYIELPYGYVVSSLLSIGKSEVASPSSLSISGFSNESDSSGVVFENVTKFLDGEKSEDRKNSSDSLISSDDSIDERSSEFLDEKKSKNGESSADSSNSDDDSVVEHSSADFLEMNHPGNESLAAGTEIEHVHDLPVPSYTSVRNSSVESLRGTNAVPSSIIEYKGSNRSAASTVKDPAVTVQNKEKASLRHSQLSTEVNSSAIRRSPKRTRFKGAPAVVLPISKMNDLLAQSHASYRSAVRANSTQMHDI